MGTRIKLHQETPEKRLIRKCVEIFNDDGLVVYPTDSGYSVGCNAMSVKAVRKLYQLKRGIKRYIMSIMFHEFSSITDFARVDNFAYRYMKHLLPGPYTFILPATKQATKILDVNRQEVGIRMPDHPFFKALYAEGSFPILNTAAKTQEADAFLDPDEIWKHFGHQTDLVLDMGIIPITPTTVISLVDGAPEVIREGIGAVP